MRELTQGQIDLEKRLGMSIWEIREKIHPKVETKTEDGITVITIRTAQAIDNVDVYFRGEGDR